MCCDSDGCVIPIAPRGPRERALVDDRDEALELAEVHSQNLSHASVDVAALDLSRQTGETRVRAGDRDQSRQHLGDEPRGVDPVLRGAVRDGAHRDADVRDARAMAARRRSAAPPLPRRERLGAEPSPPRPDDRRLRGRLRGDPGAHVDAEWGAAARRAPLRAGAALLPRSRRQPDRAELARRVDARPVAVPGAPQARRRTSRRRPSRSEPSSTSTGAASDGIRAAPSARSPGGAPVRSRCRPVRCRRSAWTLLAVARRRARAVGALPRADDGEVGDLVRLGGARPEGLPDHAPERRHGRRALLRRRERVHADLRPDARRQHGARRVLPPRRLRRAQAAAPPGRRRRLVRAARARR